MTVTVREGGTRLDAFLAAEAELSRAAAARLIEAGYVTVNGKPAKKNTPLSPGDLVEYSIPAPTEITAAPENIPLDIVYEDGDLLVINKPSGMVVHPAPGNPGGTLVNALLYHCAGRLSGINGELRPGIVHRIDKDTSGLLVVAKTDAAHRALAADLAVHAVRRSYRALVRGGFSADSGTVDLPIGRHPVDRKRMAVIRNGGSARPAVTHFRVLRRFGDITYLALDLETGRTHQIRVHMAATGHPLLGDPVYGAAPTAFERHHAPLFDGQCLHAAELSFRHPTTGEDMHFSSPLPENFLRLLSILEADER